MWRSGCTALFLSLPTSALAIPGPDTTAVLAHGRIPESVALAERYVAARSIPLSQLCLVDPEAGDTIDHEMYLTAIERPLIDCLGPVVERIEAVVLVRGLPLRVRFPDRGDGAQRASLAAVLGVARSVGPDGQPLSATGSPGRRAMCGNTPCTVARWSNPYREGRFSSDFAGQTQGILHRPWLVTALEGRSYEDAARLVASATTAESSGPNRARRFLLMEGADRARGVLDVEYPIVASGLDARGFEADVVAFDRDRAGETLAGFVTGAASLGRVIEDNDFAPGALVDNLTSFGAVPENFLESGQRQVSIARWVAKGVAGVHGTTDEPLNNSFPSRRFLIDWADGLSLAEAYHRNLPFVFWHNLVLGDPMAAAWARRPEVSLDGPAEVRGSARFSVRAEGEIRLYLDGLEIARGPSPLDPCVDLERPATLLAVARTDAAVGWTALELAGEPGPPGCPPPAMDAGVEIDAGLGNDAGLDAGGPDIGHAEPDRPIGDGGCRGLGGRPVDPLWLALLALVRFTRRQPLARHAGREDADRSL